MQTFEQLNELIIEWAEAKGILKNSTPLTQLSKTQEELDETKEALLMRQNGVLKYVNSKGKEKFTREEIPDGYGDQLVTILIGMKMNNIDPVKCLEDVYKIISKRKGVMKDGVFVKEEENPNQTSILDYADNE